MEVIQECKNISEIKEKLLNSILLDEIKETCMKENSLDYAIQNKKNLAANYYIETKLSEITQNTVDTCVRCNNVEILTLLHEKFPAFFTQENLNNFLMWVVSDPGTEQMAKFLIKHGADVNFQQSLPLWEAVNRKNLFFAKFLLKHGAKITCSVATKSIQKDTFSLPIFELLINHDIDVSFFDFYLLKYAGNNNIDSALKLILQKMKEKDLLKDQIEVLSGLLINAALHRDMTCVYTLVEYGADVKYKNNSALFLAEYNGHTHLAQYLRNKGATTNSCVIL